MLQKICVSAFIFAVIGFLAYLFIVITSFIGCCVGLSLGIYNIIVICIVGVSAIFGGLCLYNNCSKIKNPSTNEGVPV